MKSKRDARVYHSEHVAPCPFTSVTRVSDTGGIPALDVLLVTKERECPKRQGTFLKIPQTLFKDPRYFGSVHFRVYPGYDTVSSLPSPLRWWAETFVNRLVSTRRVCLRYPIITTILRIGDGKSAIS